ncbi:MAG: redox-regulated ATPase YchF [Candidatus Micrarchaeia archaeon]|jgi:hypothetical protein
MLDIGICGKPNCGKSTFFSAATMVDVAIANYPFTTIEANRGVAYVRSVCPCKEFGKKCNPRNSKCVDGVRLVPLTVIDVAGLVPGAHEGKGLGNKFLDDLRNASAIIQVVDASGKTDLEGKPAEGQKPEKEVEMLEEEVARWMAGIIMRGVGLRKKLDAEQMAVQMSGLGMTREHVIAACNKLGRTHDTIAFEKEEEVLEFARALRQAAKPILVAANKIDIGGAEANCEQLEGKLGKERVVRCFADGELALRKAEKAGLVKYVPGAESFEILRGEQRQKDALGRIGEVVRRNNGTGVQQALDRAAFGLLGLIVVYPVEDATKLSDAKGNVLPDAILLKSGSTPLDLARAVHTELAEKFICAIDVRKGMKVGKEHVLKDGDVLRIVTNR